MLLKELLVTAVVTVAPGTKLFVTDIELVTIGEIKVARDIEVTMPLVVRILPIVLLRVKLKLIALLEMMLKLGLCFVADVVRVTTPVTGVALMLTVGLCLVADVVRVTTPVTGVALMIVISISMSVLLIRIVVGV